MKVQFRIEGVDRSPVDLQRVPTTDEYLSIASAGDIRHRRLYKVTQVEHVMTIDMIVERVIVHCRRDDD